MSGTIEITKEIKRRWDAKSLGSSVTGGIWHGRPSERSVMPYCIYNEVSANMVGETASYRLCRMEAQFDIYTNSGDPEVCADLATTVRDTFVNGDRALATPIQPTSDTGITEMRLGQDITTTPEGDEQVFRSRFSLVVFYTERPNRTPA